MNNIVPILITCDIDPTPEVKLKSKISALEQTCVLFEKYGIKATFFIVADIAKFYNSQIKQLLENSHEIGCHGLTHALEEEYSRLPEKKQRDYLTKATHILEDLTMGAIRAFRGPRVKTSHVTQHILEELNYLVDSSVCSQRIDFISSNLIHSGWIVAPRLPYRPCYKNAYKKGNRNLWVVPISALILPFISSTLYAFGTSLMKRFFDVLYYESKRTGKPIVYLMHPSEFAPIKLLNEKISFQSIKARGFYIRRRFKLRINEQKRLEYTKNLFEYMALFGDVQFMTMSSYLVSLQLESSIRD